MMQEIETETVLKITVIILFSMALIWYIGLSVKKIYFLKFRQNKKKGFLDEKFAFLIIDIDITKENTEFVIKEITNAIAGGNLSYIDKILLFDRKISTDFFKSLQSVHNTFFENGDKDLEQKELCENIKMCEIISRNYTNVFYLK